MRQGSLGLRVLWLALFGVVVWAIAVATQSPWLAWRDSVYVLAGFAGVVGLSILTVQPLLARGHVPSLSLQVSRWVHRAVGGVLVTFVTVHVIGLWITSPPDVVDALLFRSPTPFSAWGVVAMWAVLAMPVLVVFRRRIGWRPQTWRLVHAGFGAVVVVGTVVHALLIEGTMGVVSKWTLCAAAMMVTAWCLAEVWVGPIRKRIQA
ncbi:MAG: ferric reductase-like transmembrane domain-containing protein [Pseudomonadota bacterium]